MIITAGTPICNALDPPIGDDGNPALGSIGGAVYDAQGNIFLLTCYHCVINQHLSYDEFIPGNGNDIVNGYFGGHPTRIGQIIKAKKDALIDFAVIQPDLQNNQIDFNINTIGAVSGIGILTPNDRNIVQVQKYGGVTHYTKGTYIGVAPSTGAPYPVDNKQRFLSNLLMINGSNGYFSDLGDSGAFVINSQNQMVGIIAMWDGDTSYAMTTASLMNFFSFTFNISI